MVTIKIGIFRAITLCYVAITPDIRQRAPLGLISRPFHAMLRDLQLWQEGNSYGLT